MTCSCSVRLFIFPRASGMPFSTPRPIVVVRWPDQQRSSGQTGLREIIFTAYWLCQGKIWRNLASGRPLAGGQPVILKTGLPRGAFFQFANLADDAGLLPKTNARRH